MRFESQMSAREVLQMEQTFGARINVPARVRRTIEALEASDRGEQLRCNFGECGQGRCSGCGVPLPKGGA